MVETGFMQVSFVVKPYFFDIFSSGCLINAHELSFWSLWPQDFFIRSIWRSSSQNYSLALEMLNGDNMQGNASGVKCEMQNGVSTSSAFNQI